MNTLRRISVYSNDMAMHEDYKMRMFRVLLEIEAALDHSWTLEELARIASFSPYHFHRQFTAMVGESVASYIRRVRLERAAGLLSSTDRTVAQIAAEAGYTKPEVFSRAFARRFGTPPNRFREAVKDWAVKSGASSVESGDMAERVMSRWRAQSAGEQRFEEVEIVELPPMRCAVVRARGRYALAAPRAWLRLGMWARRRGVRAQDRRRFTIGHDDPALTDEPRLRVDACLSLECDESPDDTESVGVLDIPGSKYARLVHKGSIRSIPETFAVLYGCWLPQSGLEPASAAPLIEHLDARFPYGPPSNTAVLLPLLTTVSSNPSSDHHQRRTS